MKKSLILALALVAPAMAGDEKAAPIADIVDIPTPTQPVVQSSWGVEIVGTHTWAVADAYDGMHNINSWGVGVTGVYNINDNLAATVRFTYANGCDSKVYVEDSYYDKFHEEITNMTVTVGLRYTAPITEKLSWFAGANVGIGYSEIEDTNTWGDSLDNYSESYKGDADDFGLAYSVEAGLKYDVCESAYIIGSVGFNGVWTTPDWEGGYNDGQQTGIIVSLGVGYKF